MLKKLSVVFCAFLISCTSTQKSSSQQTPAPTPKPPAAKIAPVHTDITLQKIAFGSCQHQKFPQPIWKDVLKTHPDLYIGMGDNVYASLPEDQPISKQYELQAQVPGFKELRAHTPMIATWDDHDAEENDGGAKNPKLGDAKAEFLKFFPYDAAQIPAQEAGVYHSFIFGDAPHRVQVILLDTRTYRDDLELNPNPKSPLDKYVPTKDIHKSFLGEEQWKWFESELLKPADLRFIISSVEFLPEEHGFEKWANFPHERTRLLRLLKLTGAKNVVILSGDRHMAEISRMKVPDYGDLWEVTSSGINRVSNITSEPNKFRQGKIYPHENFGLATIDWKKKKISIDVIGLGGKHVLRMKQKLKSFQ